MIHSNSEFKHLNESQLNYEGRKIVTIRKTTENKARMSLIDATAKSICEFGITGTTVTTIVRKAEMSRGMLHRYFASKNELLAATAENASAFYYDVISRSLCDVGEKPYARLRAIVEADLGPELLNTESVVLWNALRSVAQSDKQVRAFSSTRDESLQSTLRGIYEDILGLSPKEPEVAGDLANGTIALLEGMWADYFLYPDRFNREKAISIVMRFIDGQLK